METKFTISNMLQPTVSLKLVNVNQMATRSETKRKTLEKWACFSINRKPSFRHSSCGRDDIKSRELGSIWSQTFS